MHIYRYSTASICIDLFSIIDYIEKLKIELNTQMFLESIFKYTS